MIVREGGNPDQQLTTTAGRTAPPPNKSVNSATRYARPDGRDADGRAPRQPTWSLSLYPSAPRRDLLRRVRGQQRNGSIGIVINCVDQNRGRKLEDTKIWDKLAILV